MQKEKVGDEGSILHSVPAVIVCIGIELFAETLREQGVDVISIYWRPPHKTANDIKQILNKFL